MASIIDATSPGAAAEEELSYWRQVAADRASAREVIDADDLARISAARHRAQALSNLGDRLVDHSVSEA
ncbi:MAG: hypothetical protein ABI083_00225 [Lapillicoccus sp.]